MHHSAPRLHYLPPYYLNSLNKSTWFTLVLRQVFSSSSRSSKIFFLRLSRMHRFLVQVKLYLFQDVRIFRILNKTTDQDSTFLLDVDLRELQTSSTRETENGRVKWVAALFSSYFHSAFALVHDQDKVVIRKLWPQLVASASTWKWIIYEWKYFSSTVCLCVRV